MTQKEISIDTVTGQKYGVTDLEGFFKMVNSMLYKFWPSWKGKFVRVNPSAVDSESLESAYIAARIMLKEPMKVDTEFGRNNPRTKTPATGLIQPRLMKTIEDKSLDDLIEIYCQSYDCIVRFNIYTKTTEEMVKLANDFEKFLRQTRAYYIKNGIRNLVFIKYFEDITITDRFKEPLREACFDYFVQYDDVWEVRIPRIKEVSVLTKALDIIPEGYDLPLETDKYDKKVNVAGALSQKIP